MDKIEDKVPDTQEDRLWDALITPPVPKKPKPKKWKHAPKGTREGENNAMKLEDMKAGNPPWGNGCERWGCLLPSTGWIEVDGIIYEVCETHRTVQE